MFNWISPAQTELDSLELSLNLRGVKLDHCLMDINGEGSVGRIWSQLTQFNKLQVVYLSY